MNERYPPPSNATAHRQARLISVHRTDPRFLEGITVFSDHVSLYADRVISSPVEGLFQKGWLHPKKQMPHIYSVYRVNYSQARLKPFLQYR